MIFSSQPASITYAAVGYDHNGQAYIWDTRLTIAYDAPSNTYLAGYSTPPERVDEIAGSTDRFLSTNIGMIYKSGPTNSELALTYSSLVANPLPDPWDYSGSSFVAFGQATPPGGTPVTGSASYNGVAYGQSMSTNYNVRGAVLLNLDFGAATLSGHFDPILEYYADGSTIFLPRQMFADTVFARGGQTFSGAFAGLTGSSFNGQFTGPAAEEFIARFRQPLLLPGALPDEIVGVWVGKR